MTQITEVCHYAILTHCEHTCDQDLRNSEAVSSNSHRLGVPRSECRTAPKNLFSSLQMDFHQQC